MEIHQGTGGNILSGGMGMTENKFFPEIHGNFGFGCMRLPMKDGKVDYAEFSRMA